MARCVELKSELRLLQARELMDVNQQLHIAWLMEGDQSTTFFGCTIKI